MQPKAVSACQLRNRLGEYLNLVYYQGQEIIVEKMRKPIIKIIPFRKENPEKKFDFNPPVFNLGGIKKIYRRKEIYEK